MDLLTVGEPGPGKRSVWFIARQHPGETMAEYYMEGLLVRRQLAL
jgi:murein tripeptide amidase MpaA